jgi:hypothetical protein
MSADPVRLTLAQVQAAKRTAWLPVLWEGDAAPATFTLRMDFDPPARSCEVAAWYMAEYGPVAILDATTQATCSGYWDRDGTLPDHAGDGLWDYLPGWHHAAGCDCEYCEGASRDE